MSFNSVSFSKYWTTVHFQLFFLLFCLFFIYLKYFKIHPDIIVTEELHHELGQVPSEFPFLIGNEGTEKKKDSCKFIQVFHCGVRKFRLYQNLSIHTFICTKMWEHTHILSNFLVSSSYFFGSRKDYLLLLSDFLVLWKHIYSCIVWNKQYGIFPFAKRIVLKKRKTIKIKNKTFHWTTVKL